MPEFTTIAPFLLVLWSLMVLFCGTAVIAVRTLSRTRLTEALKRRKQESMLAVFDEHERHYTLACQVLRQLSLVLFVLTLSVVIHQGASSLSPLLLLLLISTVWFLLLGIAIPEAWARYAGENYVARNLPLMEILRRGLLPVLKLIDWIDEIVRRLAGVPREALNGAEEMEREILDAIDQAQISGAVDRSEKDMIKSVMVLDDRDAGEIMTPRTDMIGIEVSSGFEAARKIVVDAGHSRIPVYKETMDQIVGVLYAKDLLRVTDPAAFSMADTMREVAFVPESKDLASLLKDFQSNRVHMSIVLDEYGGTSGLVTIEDILEELVGEITDEHDAPSRPPINRIDDATAEVDARVRVDELNEELEIELPEDEAYDTVGGLVFSKLGHVPVPGEHFIQNGVRIEILEAQDRSVSLLRVHILDIDEDEEE